jgi:predicted nucleotidyltransferase
MDHVEAERTGRRFAAELLATCEAALAEARSGHRGRIVGAYIHGSLAHGGYVPGRSDVDVLVVVDEPLTVGQRTSLLRALNAMAPATGRRFDLTIVTAQAASRATRRPAAEVYYGFHGGRPEIVVADYLPSLVVELSAIREAADVLVGPLPATLIPEQPTEWIDERGLELLDRWSRLTDDVDHAGLMVLIACQIWCWAVERRHASKDEAGHWVLELDPTLSAVRAALAQRRGDASRSISPSGVAQVLDAARHAVEGRGPA